MSDSRNFDMAVRARMKATGEKHAVARLHVLRTFNTVVAPYDRVVGEGAGSRRVRLDVGSAGVSVTIKGALLGVIPGRVEGGRGYLLDGDYQISEDWSARCEGVFEAPDWERVGGSVTLQAPRGSTRDGKHGVVELSIKFDPYGSPLQSAVTYTSREERLAAIDRLPAGHPGRVAFLRQVTNKSSRGTGFGISDSRVPESIDEELAEMVDLGEQPTTPVPDDPQSRADRHRLADLLESMPGSRRRALPRPAEGEMPLGDPLTIKNRGRFHVGDAWWEADGNSQHLMVRLCIGSGGARVPAGSSHLAGFVSVERDGSIRWGTKILVPRAPEAAGEGTTGGRALSKGEGRDFVVNALETVVPGIRSLVRPGAPRAALTITLGAPAK